MPARSCGSVIAGVHFFPPPRFCDQEPRGDQRQCLMVMPAAPVTDLVVCQARFALGASQAFFDAVFGLGGAGELGERSFGGRVREVVIRLRHGRLVAVPVADHDQHFVIGGFLAFVVVGADAAFQHLDDERSLRAVAQGLSGILCQAGIAEVVVGQLSVFGIRSSKRMAKWLRASFHFGMGIVHFFEAS